MKKIIEIYADLVIKELKTIDEVPEKIRQEVIDYIEQLRGWLKMITLDLTKIYAKNPDT